jgi:Fic family protein
MPSRTLFATPALGKAERRVLDGVGDLRGRLARCLHEPRPWSGSLRRLSFARAIQGSNSIEGYDAALDDAAAVAVGEPPIDASEETRLALEGYRDAMTYVIQVAHDTEFGYSAQLLKSLHFMMTKYSLDNRPGRWRAGTIYVRDERSGAVVYEGPDLDLVPGLIQELVEEMEVIDGSDSLVAAAMAHLNLVMIHPFRDGNGRMARCLQSLVLARCGVLSPEFMSIEEYLGRNTSAYYDVLARVGKGSWHPESDARPWLRFTLTAHLRQARTMLRRVKEAERLWLELETVVARHRLPERTIHGLFDAALGLRVRNSTYRAQLAAADEEVTEQTAGRDLADLVTAGLLVAHGKARGRFYVADGPTAAVHKAIVAARDPRDDSDPFA